MSGGPFPGSRLRQVKKGCWVRVVPTRRPLSCVLHDWAVRLILAFGLVCALGFAYQSAKLLWQVLR